MGSTTRNFKVRTPSLSIALILAAAPVLKAHAQIPPPGSGSTPRGADEGAAQPAGRVPWLTYGIDAGVGETDNVTLVSVNKTSQTIATTDVDFVVKGQSRLLEANATGDFSYFDYLQNAFGSQVLGRFDGQGKLAIVPERLIWVVQDAFGQASVDPYLPVTPDNVESINYFSTGPTLSLRPGVNFIELTARYARADYETSPYNSNRGLGSLAVGRNLPAGASVSLNAEFERVLFENTVANTDFDRTSGFGRYELHGLRTDFEGDLGASRIDQQGATTTGPLAKVQLSRLLSAATKLILTAGRELTDASSSFSTLQSGVIGPNSAIVTAPAVLTSNNYTSNFGSAAWQYQRHRTIIALSAQWEKDTYSGQSQLDVTHPSAGFSIRRQMTRALSADLLGRFYRTDYTNVAIASSTSSSRFDDWLLGGALTWRHGRGLEIRLRYDYNSRVVSAGGSGYSANRLFLTVGYRPRSAAEVAEPQ
jgi:hypothetical protein